MEANATAVQTVLGANGVIGRELSRVLRSMGHRVRQVSRHPRQVNGDDEVVTADLLDAEATARAVEGSTVAYLVAGLKYDHRVWREEWPRVMRNVMDACRRHGAALVFLDNVYAYGRVDGAMTEETPYNPISRKGEVRAKVATTLMDAVRRGDFVRIACELSGRPFRLQTAPRWMLSLMGVFSPIIRENMEMLYQFEHDYVFDSSRIARAFNLTATTYREGITATLGA